MDGRIFNVGSGKVRNETYEKVAISQLENAPMYPVLCGVVITKSDSRFVATKRGDRYVLNFILRDSSRDIISASCWGEEVQVKALSEIFTIGDVVKVKNPQITPKQPDSKNDKYRPHTTSPYELIVNPLHTEVILCQGTEGVNYKRFLHYTIHPPNECYNIADIVSNREQMDGASVNFLVAIKSISALQHMKTKDGRPLKKLELDVFDQSHPSFQIIIWDAEIANFILTYCAPRKVVLISDIRANYSRFINGMMATAVSSTVFTPDPEVPKARVLSQYAARVPIDENPSAGGSELRKCNIEDIRFMIATVSSSMTEDVVGIVYAYITSFDIDGSARVISRRCPECKWSVKGKRCINGNCDVGSGIKEIPAEEVFEMIIRLSDQTGSLDRCVAYAHVMETLLKCTVAEFKALSALQLTLLKWQNLFELYKIEFKIPRSAAAFERPFIRITSCTRATADDYVPGNQDV